ncbi:MAG: sigma-70 family RNA polymerase sigma factor [Chloroflexi bacterium]|nr:MAG: sigma-70 family RNA polymerase sigma factor [Chloroflexota bacterium]
MMSSDERILELLGQASPEGIELLYDRYGALAFTLARRVLDDEAAAEDVVQESFLSIWRRSATFDPRRGSLRTWVCSIVRHRALDRLRGRSGRARHDLPLELAVEHTSISDTWDQVSEQLERDAVRRALGELSPEQRQTLELAYYGGYSQSDISSLMAVPLGTVKGRTRLALRRLRQVLEGRVAWEPT